VPVRLSVATFLAIVPLAVADQGQDILAEREWASPVTGTTGPPVSVTSAEQYWAHAVFRARRNGTGIGAALIRSTSTDSEHVWECIVTDGREWHYIRVLGSGLGRFPDIPAEAIESGIERFAATLPAQTRIYNLLNANPLHIDRDRRASN
jgi:hypothetical protein